MQNLILSLNKNVLRITTVDKEGLKYISSEISEHIASDSVVLDPQQYADIIKDLVPQLTTTPSSKLGLDFLIAPEEALTLYVTVGKDVEDVEAHVVNEIKGKLEAEDLASLYFSYEKIAPFVYQFIGIRKETLERYIEIANTLGIPIRSVMPWVLLLPKYVETNDPAIFVVNNHGDQVVALSELNGVFFSTTYENEQDPEALQKLVKNLSVYKRSKPITRVFRLNYEILDINDKFEMSDIEVPSAELLDEKGYELNLIANYMLDTRKELLNTQVNVLNYISSPVVVKKNSNALVYVGAIAAIFLVVVGISYGISALAGSGENTDDLANVSQEDTAVLSESTNPAGDVNDNPPVEEVVEELNRADLTIRVENGAGIPGVAGRTQGRLEELGYVVSGVGNSNAANREDTLLKFKPSMEKYSDMLSEDMNEVYLTITVENDLPEDSAYDVLAIVGTDISE